jgi:HD superfamily phosphohydrolase
MMSGFRIRDPVHDFLDFEKEEMKLIGTPLFQRLRGIRQLAMASLVYPGAVHTRFEHSLGVCHVTGLLAGRFGLARDELRLVRLAALLHDIGHGPFSHVSENLLDRYADRGALPDDQKQHKIHELITAHLIEHDSAVSGAIGKPMAGDVVKLLSSGFGRPVLRSIVSGPLDADKQDYLLRDSRYCGVNYGIFDIQQLHRSLVIEGRKDEEVLMIDPKGIHAVEQYFLAKYYLTMNVYRHKVRIITDQMLVRAVVLGIEEDGIDRLRSVYAYQPSDRFFEGYTQWTDARLLASFDDEAQPGTLCGELIRRLQERRLLKRVFRTKIEDLRKPAVGQILLAIGSREQDTLRKDIERSVAALIGKHFKTDVDPRLVIVHGYKVLSVRTTARNEEAEILVASQEPAGLRRPSKTGAKGKARPRSRPGAPATFEGVSTLFGSINEKYNDAYVEVYAPVSWETPTDRTRAEQALWEPIREVLMNTVGAFLTPPATRQGES